jgi:multidrug efflux pump subunit AcrA (membrane-fusion protein)
MALLRAVLLGGALVTLALAVYGSFDDLVSARARRASLAAADSPPEITAVVNSRIARGIGTRFPGRMLELKVRRGQRVTRGMLLFRMDTAHLEQRLGAARGELASAERALRAARRQRAALSALEVNESGLRSRLAQARNRAKLARRQGSRRDPWVLPDPFAPQSAAYRPQVEQAQLALLEDQLRSTRRRLAAARHQWQGGVHRAAARREAAAAEVARLQAHLKQPKRFAPIDGVITSVRAGAADWVPAGVPVVRVDDPEGYQLVALVGKALGAGVEPGTPLRMVEPEGRAEVTRVLEGWGRELFRYWVWIEPAEVAALRPGQRVHLRLDEPSLTAAR